jgi:hypothetical protein
LYANNRELIPQVQSIIEESGEAVNEELDQIISNEEIVLCYI